MRNYLVTQAALSVATFVCTSRLPYLAASCRHAALFNHTMIVGSRVKVKSLQLDLEEVKIGLKLKESVELYGIPREVVCGKNLLEDRDKPDWQHP